MVPVLRDGARMPEYEAIVEREIIPRLREILGTEPRLPSEINLVDVVGDGENDSLGAARIFAEIDQEGGYSITKVGGIHLHQEVSSANCHAVLTHEMAHIHDGWMRQGAGFAHAYLDLFWSEYFAYWVEHTSQYKFDDVDPLPPSESWSSFDPSPAEDLVDDPELMILEVCLRLANGRIQLPPEEEAMLASLRADLGSWPPDAWDRVWRVFVKGCSLIPNPDFQDLVTMRGVSIELGP